MPTLAPNFHRSAILLALTVVASITGVSCNSRDRRMSEYQLWKRGLRPYDANIIEYGLRHDPNAAMLVVGKSVDDVTRMFKNVHEPDGSFQILISKTLPDRPRTRKYYQWENRYVIFEVEDGRVVALTFVHG